MQLEVFALGSEAMQVACTKGTQPKWQLAEGC